MAITKLSGKSRMKMLEHQDLTDEEKAAVISIVREDYEFRNGVIGPTDRHILKFIFTKNYFFSIRTCWTMPLLELLDEVDKFTEVLKKRDVVHRLSIRNNVLIVDITSEKDADAFTEAFKSLEGQSELNWTFLQILTSSFVIIQC